MNLRANQNYKDYYEILERIGKGAFGEVYKGKEKETNELRAIKFIDLDQIKNNLFNKYFDWEKAEKNLQSYKNQFIELFEIMKICSNNNNNSVKCYEYFINDKNFVIIMELCDTNLLQLLREKNKGFNSEEIFEIMKQLNNTFKIMKENNIIHRDLKLENIFIKYNDKEHKNFTIKLAGYGCSKKLESLSYSYCNECIGTLLYMAPEILKGKEYNYKCDLWSIGIILYRLFFLEFPFRGETEMALINNIEHCGNKLLKKTGNEDLDDLIKKLLEKEPSKRIDWDNYFNHPK